VNYIVNEDTTITAQWEFNSLIGQIGPGGGIVYYSSEAGFTVNGGGNGGKPYHYLEVAPADLEYEFATIHFYEKIEDGWWDKWDKYFWKCEVDPYDAEGFAATYSYYGTQMGIGEGRENTRLLSGFDPEKGIAEYNRDAAEPCTYDGHSGLGHVQSLNHHGKSDWFWPSKEELEAIWDYRTLQSSTKPEYEVIHGLDRRPFTGNEGDPVPIYWSSSENPNDTSQAYAVNLGTEYLGEYSQWLDEHFPAGETKVFSKTDMYRIRPVRYVTDEEAEARWDELHAD
jgi:hypothetical protein